MNCETEACEHHNSKEYNHCARWRKYSLPWWCSTYTSLKTKKEPVATVLFSEGLEGQELRKQLQRLLNKVNAVTCPYRHGQKVTDRVLTELSNRQLEVEEALREMAD